MSPKGLRDLKDAPCRLKLSEDDLQKVFAAFDALMVYQPLTDRVERSVKTLQNLLLDTWRNGAWKWIVFFYNGGLDLNDTLANPERPFPFPESICVITVFATLKGATISTSLCKEVINCPTVLGIIGYMWVDDPKLEQFPDPHTVQEELTVAIQNVSLDDKRPREDEANSHRIIFEAAEQRAGAKTVMKKATAHLERLIVGPVLDASEIHKDAYLLNRLPRRRAYAMPYTRSGHWPSWERPSVRLLRRQEPQGCSQRSQGAQSGRDAYRPGSHRLSAVRR
ncbi:hypothetical protein BDZ89DRAFT_404906 [Hymenopellis radicata]|nr:hypothetical protein BDZ89DRAFT_404906 [Hymenopellis radicata]